MVKIDWRPSNKKLRRFGVVVMVGLCLIGLFLEFYSKNTSAAQVAYIAGAVLGVPALTGTVIGLPGYWLWMGIAFVMGNIMSRVLLTLVYHLLFTPMGLVRRALGNDRLALKRRDKETYWIELDQSTADSARHERQF